MVDGQRHRVKCSDLNLPESQWTKEGSYQAAKAWLENKLAAPAEQLAELDTLVDGLARKAIMSGVDNALMQTQELIGKTIKNPAVLDRAMNRAINMAESISIPSAAPSDFALEPNAERFLELERAKGKKPRTYGELSESIDAIIRTTHKGQPLLSPDMDVRRIDETTVTDFYLFLRNESKREDGQQKKQFGFFKRLVKYFWGSRLIDMPRNLGNRWDFSITAKEIKEYDRAEVVALLSKLPDRLKLYALLGLNCGMLSVDISSLRKDQIDMVQGRIKRKRTKTEKEKNVPVSDYKLWPITFALLKKCLSADLVLAFTTMNGTPLVACRIDANGEEKRKNMVRDQWKRAKKFMGKTKIPHKAFRTIGATALKADAATIDYYLGHSPKRMQDKHYKAPDRDEFDKIIMLLGKQFDQSK